MTFTFWGQNLILEIKCNCTQTRENRKPSLAEEQERPGTCLGKCDESRVQEEPKTRHTLHLRLPLAAPTFPVVSRQKKGPTVAPQTAPFMLVSSAFIGRRETRSKQTRSCGWCLTCSRQGEAGPRWRPLVRRQPHMRLTYAKMQTSLSDNTRGKHLGAMLRWS